MLESIQIEGIDSIPAVDAEQVGVGLHVQDNAIEQDLVQTFAAQ